MKDEFERVRDYDVSAFPDAMFAVLPAHHRPELINLH